MTAHAPIAVAPSLSLTGWRAHLAGLAACWAAILLLFLRDAADMAGIWWTSATFNHCLLIPPLIGWLVWQRLSGLRQLAPAAWTPGLAVVGLGGLAWLVGEAGGVALARHLGLILMLQGAVIACLGKAVSRALAFPLFFAFFLVPTGEEFVPVMQTVTAKMSMALLALSGVPAHIQGVFITTPTGYFEVAEACSGVRFLVAMAALGALVANVCFTSPLRRAAFVAAALIIPVFANGIRAWGTIYVAYLTDNDFAVGFDHILYGWIFFAIVIALLMAAGWPFFDRRPGDPWFDPAALQRAGAPPGSPRLLTRIAAGAVALAALPLLWSSAVAYSAAPVPADIVLPAVPGWQRVPDNDIRPWRPRFAGAEALRIGRYRDARGRQVDLAIALFARQQEGAELVGYGQGAAPPDGDWAWTADLPAPQGARAERLASFGRLRDVVSFYRVGDLTTGSAAAVKLETMKARLLGGRQSAVAILVSAEGGEAGAAIRAFLAALGPVDQLADGAAGLPQSR
jgi:exosortase A